MPGQIKSLIDELIKLRTFSNPNSGHFIRVHLMLKGINPDDYDEDSFDNPDTINTLQQMIDDFRKQK